MAKFEKCGLDKIFLKAFRIKSRRIKAYIETPERRIIDLLSLNDKGCRMAGEPGWSTPLKGDFVMLKPGKSVYLLASGSLRCF